MYIEDYETSTEVNNLKLYAFFRCLSKECVCFLSFFFSTNYDDYYKVCFWFSLLHNLASPLNSVWSCFKETGNNHIQEFVWLIQRSQLSGNNFRAKFLLKNDQKCILQDTKWDFQNRNLFQASNPK